MKLEFGSFVATDGVKLPGLLYAPDKPTRKIALWLHGMNSSIFYSPTWINALGQNLTKRGISLFAFNNRGAYDAKRLRLVDDAPAEEEDGRFQGGTHYELIADCVHDIDGAVELVREAGYSEFYLLGHSTGANKICAYDARTKSNPFSKYVLAGPGDDIGLAFVELGATRFWKALDYAAKKVSGGNPLQVMPKYSGMYPFSAQSAWDILNPDGAYNTFPFYEASKERLGSKPLFAEYRAIKTPTLVIIGEQDEYMTTAGGSAGALDILMSQTSNTMLKNNDFMLVPFADHSFHTAEDTFAEKVGDWLL
jgi:alpha-beta hydrolase superfamily lysophospholipase